MLVKDYMTRHPLMADPTMSIVEAQRYMGENNIRHLPIVGDGKRLLGDGQFLDSEHTLARFREKWYPGVFERGNYDQWQAAGGKSLAERAVERVEEILADHQPEPLPDDVVQAIKAIIRRAEEQEGSTG